MKWPTQSQLKKLKIGDLVTTNWYKGEEKIVRRVVAKQKLKEFESGYVIAADGGDPCLKCGRPLGSPTPGVDGNWFIPVEENK